MAIHRDHPRSWISIPGGDKVKNHLLWKWLGRFSLLLLAFLLVQSVLFYALENTLYRCLPPGGSNASPSSLSHYEVSDTTGSPVDRDCQEILTGISDRQIRSLSDDEVGRLSQVINEIGTQLKNRIEDIAKEKEYLQAVLTGMVEGVLVVDSRARIVMANDALRQFLSLPSNVTDRTPLEVIRNSELEGAIRKVIREGGRQVLELNLPPSGGQTLEVNVVGISSASAGGRTGGRESRWGHCGLP